ncbi:MAG: hypothetical protein SGJ03_16135 [Alphaproteobacteria bacterium]|nr:hypothetical protein [Alphaproteobacteria bacterium]
MIKTPTPSTDEQVRALLARLGCPVPFHEVRTRFLGNIATPNMSTSPMKVVADLWGGELPEFDSIDAVNELIGALIGGLWNRLTAHQHRSSPFHLTRADPEATRDDLAALALMRRQEIDGFIEGLFGKEKIVYFPDRAHRALNELGQMRALFAGVADIAADETKPGSIKDMETTHRHLREITRNAEHEINSIVIACRIARKQMLAGSPANKPTVH